MLQMLQQLILVLLFGKIFVLEFSRESIQLTDSRRGASSFNRSPVASTSYTSEVVTQSYLNFPPNERAKHLQSIPIINELPERGAEENNAEATACPICLGTFGSDTLPTRTLDCNHCFHENCIEEWLKKSGTCPMCRQSLSGMTTIDLLEERPEAVTGERNIQNLSDFLVLFGYLFALLLTLTGIATLIAAMMLRN